MKLRWSVRKLIEFTLRSGDIDGGVLSHRRALEGIRLHQKLQDAYPPRFESEVDISTVLFKDGTEILLEGRMDGIDREGGEIDEIKSTTATKEELDAHPNALHWAQLKCYGYLYCKNEEKDEVRLRLRYIRVEDEAVFTYTEVFQKSDLERFVFDVIDRYWEIQKRLDAFSETEIASMRALRFPYPRFRPGQRETSVAVYQRIREKGALLIQAPTGIGKTLATLFPAIKAVGEDIAGAVFYATGRSTQKDLAFQTLRLLEKNGLATKSVELVAREKACLNDTTDCRPEACPYAKGHYDRLIEGIIDIYERENIFDAHTIRTYSETHRLCPFEFGLDLSNFARVLVGDYNYIFHPKSFLERLMEDRKRTRKTALLIDEAHNLCDRGRDMYSGKLNVEDFDGIDYPTARLKRLATAVQEKLEAETQAENRAFTSLPKTLTIQIENLIDELASYFAAVKGEPDETLTELYFMLLDWQNLLSYYDADDFTFFVPRRGALALLCLDAKQVLAERRRRFLSAIYFSATLKPFDYHAHCLGAGDDAAKYAAPSPFDPAHLLILHPPEISVKYKDRVRSLDAVSEYLRILSESKTGNYIHFFPSYAYKDMVAEKNKDWEDAMHDQTPGMTERERRAFIQRFFAESPVHGYCVMGGVFSEGVDLPDTALTGASVLTLALPTISPERELLRRRFYEKGYNGFDYAYTYPGLIKVVQAAGRIIRTETDRGVLLLLDRRFSDPAIRALLPDHWHIRSVSSRAEMQSAIDTFWRNQ